ncbi:WhiB family transcriptional regulator [Streptomyces violaceus]|uniref:WhiB family transcriptional regulator n=1 Tax=Streptomyces violaceus TaxID=1936 RepID=A0ABY9UMV3_STRVL|nr:WhiB family transcriptional regulator [Streptomyces janthinus]WND24148.1 WhiB family transcriptional regulator [Streptomyces janthinus]
MDAKTAHEELTEHPHYKYRGCASDPDDPRRAAGNPALSVDAWQSPDVDGGEEKEVREAREDAAREVCVECPVMVQCLAYGSSLTPSGKLAEPYAILGGMTALERHKALVEFLKERQEAPVRVEPAPVEQLRTAQKLAVLAALARFEEPELIAAAARVDVRTAKWQISRLTTQLGLEKTATRVELLEAAVARGLLDRSVLAPVPAARPAAVPAASSPVPLGRRSRARRVPVVRGQLAFDFDDSPPRTRPVTSLFSSTPVLEAAA